MSLILNTCIALRDGQALSALMHAFLPILLVVLTEYGQDVLLKFTALRREAETTQDGTGLAVTPEPARPVLPTQDLKEIEAAIGVPVVGVGLGSNIPTELYRLLDADEKLLYAGIGWSAKNRITSHRDTKTWWGEVALAQIETYPTRLEALAAEKAVIETEHPKYNITSGSLTDQACDPDQRRAVWVALDPAPTPIPTTRRAPVPVEDALSPGGLTDGALTRAIQEWADQEGSVPSRDKIRQRYRVGTKRADRIRSAVLTRGLTPPKIPDSTQGSDLQRTPLHAVTAGSR
jgi:predicted GIY-YIG superfamily endonuclease